MLSHVAQELMVDLRHGMYYIVFPEKISITLDALDEVYLCPGPCAAPVMWTYYQKFLDDKKKANVPYDVYVLQWGPVTNAGDRSLGPVRKRQNHALFVGPLPFHDNNGRSRHTIDMSERDLGITKRQVHVQVKEKPLYNFPRNSDAEAGGTQL